MTLKRPLFMLSVAALGLGAVAAGAANPTATQKCEARKNNVAGEKAECLAKEHGKQALGKTPNFAKCELRFMNAFAKAEQVAGPGVCPTEGDAPAVKGVIDVCVGDVATALSGGTPVGCQQFPATGQTIVHRTGDDGDIQAGATLDYTDNGDGTITDNNTGLQWEKKSDDGTIHDKDTTYTWEDAFAVHVATLNTDQFAGHTDWRLPNARELVSIVNSQNFNPSVSPAFNTNCVANATVLTGSCTSSFYWSSTSFAFNPDVAWVDIFSFGGVTAINKHADIIHVRAVRGGL